MKMYCCFFDNLAFVLQIYALFIFYLACITNIGVCALCGIIFDVTEEMYIYIYIWWSKLHCVSGSLS